MARHQSASAILDVGQGPESIVLQFEEPIGMVEWFQRSSQFCGYNRWQHAFILSRTLQ
jgi:hypothetical protein